MKQRVLLLTNKIMSYRIPIFNLLGEKYDFTVAYSLGKAPTSDINFNTLYLPAYKLGRFVIQKRNIYKLASSYDVVIYTGDIAWLKYSLLPFRKRNFKIICWGIGVSASYEKEFDAVKKWDAVRDFFYSRADALLFYSSYPISKYVSRGFNREKLFVAPNTVHIMNTGCAHDKESILFIGTLYKAKGITELLEAYKVAYSRYPDLWGLNIVGGGDGYNEIREWIDKNNLGTKIEMLGPIYDERKKENLFKSAIICVSPRQAGLGVLESMGHGTAFVTRENAITGGERLNIESWNNGILFENSKELEDILVDSCLNPEKYLQIGQNAKEYYINNRTPQHMVSGFESAISYVLSTK